MADERVKRILRHTIGGGGGGGGESKACGNSVSEESLQFQPGRSTGGLNCGLNASSGHRSGHWLARRSGSSSKFDEQTIMTSSSGGPGESGLSMGQDAFDSEAGETSGMNPAAREGMMNPVMGLETGGSTRRWPADWPVADDCIFCKIVHGFAPAFKLYEDDYCMCILDKNPLCYGHSLLVPKGHFPALDVTPPPIAAAMCSVVPLLSNVIMEATSCDSFNMVVNNGEAAGQVVFHTHFHIVPRFSGDGLWTNESVVRKTLSTFKDPSQLAHLVRSKLRSRT